MKSLVLGLLALSSTVALGQNKELTADESIPIPKVAFDAKGELQITASSNSSPDDFDFLVGKWKMHNRHLNKRLANCHDWTEFDSSDANTKILNGAADMDTYSTTEFPGLEGKLFEGLTLRLFDPKTRSRGSDPFPTTTTSSLRSRNDHATSSPMKLEPMTTARRALFAFSMMRRLSVSVRR